MTYTDETIPVLWNDGGAKRHKPTQVATHPAGRFAFYQHDARRDQDAAIIHVATGVQLDCRGLSRAMARACCEHLMEVESDDPTELRTVLQAYISRKGWLEASL
jgi:hypothetical protein